MKGLIEHYDEMWEDHYIPPYVTSLFPLFDTLELSDQSKVLDVACGNGVLGKYLIDRYNCQLFGTDISETALNRCKLSGYKIERVNLDNQEIPFMNEGFELVILSAMLEHVMEPERIVETAFKQLNPGGRVIILTPNIVWFVNRVLFCLGRWEHRLMGGMKGHISYRNKRQLSQMIKRAGFQNLNWDFSVFCVAGNSDFCTKGVSGWLIQKTHNLRVRFWHSFFAFNYIVIAEKTI